MNVAGRCAHSEKQTRSYKARIAKMKFSHIFDVFSKRNKVVEPFIYGVPTTLRNKVLLFCRDVFTNNRSYGSGRNCTKEFWDEVHQALLYRHGRLQLTDRYYPQSSADDVVNFLLACRDEEFLDFVEYIFRVRCLPLLTLDENSLVEELNELFASEGVGYELTEMIKERVVEPVNGSPFFGQEREVIRTISYPVVVKKDNQVTHITAIKPALQLLADQKFTSANLEFLEALEDYRKGDFGDCLTKCCSAFESVMKVICHHKGWQYQQTDTASALLSAIIKHTDLDPFFEHPLIIIATLRNRLSKSHGAGVEHKSVSQNKARFALNSTASAIILLINETK